MSRPATSTTTGLHAGGTVDILCWCQAEVVAVSLARFSRQLTESCGRPTCKAPRGRS